MKERVFETLDGRSLVVKHRRSAIIFEANINSNEKPDFKFKFPKDNFNEFARYMESIANEIWSNFAPKDATSEASDYYEYYDKELDNNGYLSICKNCISVEGPQNTTGRIYQFNKAKMQCFIYDLRKLVS